MEKTHINKILLVEDSEEDYTATLRAFAKSSIENPVFRCSDGDEVLDYLYRQNQFKDLVGSPYPVLILLDLNLPATDGKTVLSQIKQDELLKKIPVVILSTSRNQTDVNDCYLLGASSYIVKEADFDHFTQTIQAFKQFWLKTALLPGA
ncbi:response regulator [Rhodocytophaga rosea]|uniref:response regulator n=1 Tax=Rhodocytophaga rosea TaxID=2704465 RepID=UPI001E658DCA|nr:response regulator [Rhodocytophaga rosea]